MRIGLMYDPAFLEHRCGYYDHPERPERLEAVLRGIESFRRTSTIADMPARDATEAELLSVHTEKYVLSILDVLKEGGYGQLDPDTFYSHGTHSAALKAVGGGIDLALAVHDKKCDLGFAAPRPPGHHATSNRSMGFCIFNNIGAAARALISTDRARRVAIFDWDVHHGNGTQDLFYDDPNVLYISIHQWPFYPGTGRLSETGSEKAPFTTANIPLLSGAVDDDYIIAVDLVVLPLLERFKPDHILISAGYDAHAMDPLAGMNLSTMCFFEMASRLKLSADSLCDGRMTIFLEGGYNLKALEESVAATLRGISKPLPSKTPPMDISSHCQRIIRDAVTTLVENPS